MPTLPEAGFTGMAADFPVMGGYLARRPATSRGYRLGHHDELEDAPLATLRPAAGTLFFPAEVVFVPNGVCPATEVDWLPGSWLADTLPDIPAISLDRLLAVRDFTPVRPRTGPLRRLLRRLALSGSDASR